MTATGHALVGGAIAVKVTNPWIGLPLCFISHFVFDKLPHWDPMTNKKKSKTMVFVQTVADVLLSFGLVWLIFVWFLKSSDPTYVFIGAIISQLPDWMEAPYIIFKQKLPLVYQNYQIQKWVHDVWFDSRLDAPWGIVTQVAVAVVFIFWAIL